MKKSEIKSAVAKAEVKEQKPLKITKVKVKQKKIVYDPVTAKTEAQEKAFAAGKDPKQVKVDEKPRYQEVEIEEERQVVDEKASTGIFIVDYGEGTFSVEAKDEADAKKKTEERLTELAELEEG